MSTAKRVEKLRALMAEKGMDAYVSPPLIFIRANMSVNTLRQENSSAGSADLTEPQSSQRMTVVCGPMDVTSSRRQTNWKAAASV